MCNGTANKFHKVVLHVETLVYVTGAIVATVAEVESGSTFGVTCLATKLKRFHETDHVTRCNAFAQKFQLKVSTCNSDFTLSTLSMLQFLFNTALATKHFSFFGST